MFVQSSLEEILPLINRLDDQAKPSWGELTPQEMVEHLTDTLKIASGDLKQKLLIPAEKIESMQRFLETDKEMVRNIEVPFAPKERVLINESISDAIDKFVEQWIAFEEHFENEDTTELHPFYGDLNFDQWKKLNSKHLTHHFKQFHLIK
jgi:hydroxymethylglutaryl-CoA reductase